MTKRFKTRISILIVCAIGAIALCYCYVKSHPLVFNESFLSHAHCIKGAGLALIFYADENGGNFPFHPDGYGDALLLLDENSDDSLTGPGYDTRVLKRVRKTGENAPENEFGRVYVQGLSETSDPNIALLFDKLPTPGGDHCHLFRRMTAPLGREVWTIGLGMQFIPESEWPAFSKNQIGLLVNAGIAREQAEAYYSEKAMR